MWQKYVIGVLVAASLGLLWQLERKNTAIANLELQIAQDQRDAEKQANDWAANVIAAINEGRIRENLAKANATAAADDAAGLRDTVEVLNATLDTIAADAVREYASTAGRLLASCSERYTGVAAKAQGHYTDTVTLQKAWPK